MPARPRTTRRDGDHRHKAMELMGSYGYIRDYHVEKYWRDVKEIQLWLGGHQLAQFDVVRRYYPYKTRAGLMDLFDDTIYEIRTWFEAKTKSGQSRRFFLSPSWTDSFSADDLSGNGRKRELSSRKTPRLNWDILPWGPVLPPWPPIDVGFGLRRMHPSRRSGNLRNAGTGLPFAQIIIAALKGTNEIDADIPGHF